MKTLLTCNGLRVGGTTVPPFTASAGEHIGIAIPADYGLQWNELMLSLGGLRPTPEIHLAARSSVIQLLAFEHLGEDSWSGSIIGIAEARGLIRTSAERLVANLGLDPAQPYSDLKPTHRLVFDLRLALDLEAEIMVFSTAGLDPCGLVAVTDEVSKMLNRSAAIHVFSVHLIRHYEPLNLFSKVIRCSMLC